jgi:hypothetical protein
MLLLLALTLMHGSQPGAFTFYAFFHILHFQSSLLYIQFCHALIVFRHPTIMLGQRNVIRGLCPSLVFLCEGIHMCPLSLTFQR